MEKLFGRVGECYYATSALAYACITTTPSLTKAGLAGRGVEDFQGEHTRLLTAEPSPERHCSSCAFAWVGEADVPQTLYVRVRADTTVAQLR